MALKIRSVTGAGRSTAGDEFDLPIKDPETGAIAEGVSIRVRMMAKSRAQEIDRQYQEQKVDPKTRQMVWRHRDPDGPQQSTDHMLSEVIQSWTGFVGADDQDLICTRETIAALDDRIKLQVTTAVFGAEAVAEQSFRQPGPVLSLAPSTGEARPVLSESG